MEKAEKVKALKALKKALEAYKKSGGVVNGQKRAADGDAGGAEAKKVKTEVKKEIKPEIKPEIKREIKDKSL